MSYTYYNIGDIRTANFNSSPSKESHSFPKSSRFSYYQPPYCDNMYSIPSSFIKNNIYNNISSELINDNNLETNLNSLRITKKRQSSLPYTYHCTNPYPYSKIKNSDLVPNLSLYGKAKIYSEVQNNINSSPGPSHYKIPDIISSNGKFCTSQVANVLGTIIKPDNNRFNYLNGTKIPGPGTYKPLFIIHPNGSQISNFQNPPTTKFASPFFQNSRNQRQFRIHRNINPGPAEYLPTSEFGIYLSKHCPSNEFEKLKSDKTFIKKSFH